MDIVLAIAQVLLLVAYTLGAIAIFEGVLYWTLYRKQHRLFWPIQAVIGAGVGALIGYLAGGDIGGVLHWLMSIVGGVLAAAVLGQLAAVFAPSRQIKLAFMLMAPAILVVSLLMLYPFFFELRLAFTNLNLYTINRWIQGQPLDFVGLDNFVKVFTTSPLQTVSFWGLLLRTMIWTAINMAFHVGFGLILALLLNKNIRGRGIYRTILIIPWAMPQVIAVLSWRGEFHPQFGLINTVLETIGISGINWWSDPLPVFASCIIVNVWLGIPFMMVIFLSGLQSIPSDLYEAAKLAGASKWQEFRHITLPLLRPVVVPSVVLGTIWTFNNVNVIFLMTGQGGGNEFADILISALYKSAFSYSRYSFSAAFAMVIFAILTLIVLMWLKVSGGVENPSE